MYAQLNLEFTRRDDVWLIVVSGTLDVGTVVLLKDTIRAMGDDTKLVIDALGLTFMDSTGISAFILATKCFKYVSVAAQGPIRRMIEICGLATYLRLSATQDEAVQKCQLLN